MEEKDRVIKFESWLKQQLTDYEITCLDNWKQEIKADIFNELKRKIIKSKFDTKDILEWIKLKESKK